MKVRVIKAKIREIAEGEYEILIFVSGLWRSFGTPYKSARNIIQGFSNKKTVKRAGNKIAAALGIKLIWEEK